MTAATTPPSLGPLSSWTLDFIRTLAAFLVVLGHGTAIFLSELQLAPPRVPYLESVAVVVFFIVSGYVIAHQVSRYLAERRSFPNFFWNRFSRIYSAYIPALFFVLSVDLAVQSAGLPYGHARALNGTTFVGNLFMLQNWPLTFGILPSIPPFGSARPLWTLAIEWWIYLFVGWLIFRREALLSARPGDWIVLLCFSIVPIYSLVGGVGNALFLYWLVGAGGYVVVSRLPRFQLSGPYFIAAFLMAAVAIYRLSRVGWQAYEAAFAILLAIAFILLMAALKCLDEDSPARRPRGIIHFLAGSSFTLFLIHYPILEHMHALVRTYGYPKLSMFCLALGLSLVLSSLIAPLTEMRYRNLARWCEGLARRKSA